MSTILSDYEATEQDVQHIREWMVKMPHVNPELDDGAIGIIITACKGSLQRAKEAIEKFNALGFIYPHLYGHLDPLNETTQYYLNNEYLFPMPKKADDGSIIIIGACGPNEIDSSKFSIFELNRCLMIIYIVLIHERKLGSSKFIIVFDCKHVKLSELKMVTPTYVKDLLMTLKKFPIRFQRSHHINVPDFFQPIITFSKAFLNKKLADRIHFHTSMDELHKMLPKELLPNEFGGCAGDLDTLHNSWKKKVENYRGRLILESDRMRKLDHLRPKFHDNQGLQGSFKKLQID